MTYEIEDPAGDDEVVEAVHDLLDVGRVVPVVDVQNINIVRAEALQAVLHREHEGLDVIARVVDLLFESVIAPTEIVGILRRKKMSR